MTVNSVPLEELRFAVVMNGGVSLAVWMGGATLEIDRVTHDDGPYEHLLRMVGASARADVISGTSAGGINGAALALSQVNQHADLRVLRDVWADQGRMESLLREPFRGEPPSLLKGDELFLPQLAEAFRRLADPFEPSRSNDYPIDLTITTTLLHGVSMTTIDSLGQRLFQQVHEGRFHFRRDPDATMPLGKTRSRDFEESQIELTANRLALASRSTAGFPIAFEPSFVPVASTVGRTDTYLRPDMDPVASWGSHEGPDPSKQDCSRFAVDGGVLVNTPTKAALEAIDRMPADGPVRRVMLLLHPHAAGEMSEQPDVGKEPPVLTRSTVGLLGAMSSQAGRSFVERVEARNRTGGGRRATRQQLLADLAAGGGHPAERLEVLAKQLLPHYTSLRIRAAGDLARLVPPVEGWPVDRIRDAIVAAHAAWQRNPGTPRPGEGPVPYVPADLPPAGVRQLWTRTSQTGPGEQPAASWAWGITAVEHLAESAMDFLKRLVWVLPSGPLYDDVTTARQKLHRARADVRGLRDDLDAQWSERLPVEPDRAYWAKRLETYRYAMFDGAAPPGDAGDIARITTGGRIGARCSSVAREIAQIVRCVVGRLAISAAPPDARQLALAGLDGWITLLASHSTDAEEAEGLRSGERLLGRLLNLGIVMTCIGETTDTESEQTVELAQISLHADNPFASRSRTADDKAAGMALSRFSGFLKRSWRINDWIWGRMDAATILCRAILDPRRLRRVAELQGTMKPGADHRALADVTAHELVTKLLGGDVTKALAGRVPHHRRDCECDGCDEVGRTSHAQPDRIDARIRTAYADAVRELENVYNPATPFDDLPRSLPGLARLAAWGVHWRIAVDELPALATAIRADRIEGASRMSRGELFEDTYRSLLDSLPRPHPGDAPPGDDPKQAAGKTDEPTPDAVSTGLAALAAFDEAGIGREDLTEERSSDQMIRTAATAAGVALTVLDGERSGLGAVRPVTRALRGAALLPYWVVHGLTRSGSAGRFLALLALAVGGTLTAVALLAPLPDWASGPAAAVGAASLLSAFGYAALRTGTLLHGVVLLTPVVPLVAYAMTRVQGSAGRGVAVLLAVAALSIGLIVLGSLPAPLRSPVAALRDAVDGARQHLPRLVVTAGAWALAALAVWWVASRLPNVAWQAAATRRWAGITCAALAAIAALLAWITGRWLGRWRPDANTAWSRHEVTHPSGVTAGWSVLYGAFYLALAFILVVTPRPLDLAQEWVQATAIACMCLSFVLLLVVPLVVPWRARMAIQRDILSEATSARSACGSDEDDGPREVLLTHLRNHHRTYDFLVSHTQGDLVLSSAGERLADRLREARSSPWSAAASKPAAADDDGSRDGDHAPDRSTQAHEA